MKSWRLKVTLWASNNSPLGLPRMFAARILAVLVLAQLVGCARTPAFSADDFKRATGHSLPESAHILKSESMNWDIHGDHDACALIEVSEQDYSRLRTAMRPTVSPDEKPSNAPCSKDMYATFAQYSAQVEEWASWEGGGFRRWVLVEDKPLIMVQVATW
jgi:hypothetical protein